MNFINYHSLSKRLKLESSAENTKLWTEQKKFSLGGIKDPVAINHNEFIVAPTKAPKFGIGSLFKYNSNQNKWDKYIKYPIKPNISSEHTLAYDINSFIS